MRSDTERLEDCRVSIEDVVRKVEVDIEWEILGLNRTFRHAKINVDYTLDNLDHLAEEPTGLVILELTRHFDDNDDRRSKVVVPAESIELTCKPGIIKSGNKARFYFAGSKPLVAISVSTNDRKEYTQIVDRALLVRRRLGHTHHLSDQI